MLTTDARPRRTSRQEPAENDLANVGWMLALAGDEGVGRSDHVFRQPASRDTGLARYVVLAMIKRWNPNALVMSRPTYAHVYNRCALRALGCILVVAACYAPVPPTGAPCTPDVTACPAGQACVLRSTGFECSDERGDQSPDGGGGEDSDGDSAPNADNDNDGVRDVDDNCPSIANASQANDDADRFGDACDPCPPIADGNPVLDSDRDGVSDACDPFPQQAGDRITLFESFTGATLPAGWRAYGNWSIGGGEAIVASGAGDINYLTLVHPVTSRQAVTAQFVIGNLAGTGDHEIGPAQMFQLEPLRSIVCQFVQSWQGREIALRDTSGQDLDDAPSTFYEGMTAVLTNRRDGAVYACKDAQDTLVAWSSYTTQMPAIGLRTKSVSARFAWVLVVSGP